MVPRPLVIWTNVHDNGWVANLVSHPLGWELRRMTSDLLRSQVCRSSEEFLDTHEAWKAAMMERGWRHAWLGSG